MMEDACTFIKSIIDSWETGGDPGEEAVLTLEQHLKECRNCRSRYLGLLPLIKEDREILQSIYPVRESDTDTAADAVMSALYRSTPERTESGKTKTRRILFAAAAAVIILFGGFSIGFYSANLRGNGRNEVLVRFELAAPDAASVQLVGDFTDWNEGSLELKDKNHDGVWEIEVRLKKGKTYTYNFVINGERWIPDPSSTKQVDDGFGGASTMLQL